MIWFPVGQGKESIDVVLIIPNQGGHEEEKPT